MFLPTQCMFPLSTKQAKDFKKSPSQTESLNSRQLKKHPTISEKKNQTEPNCQSAKKPFQSNIASIDVWKASHHRHRIASHNTAIFSSERANEAGGEQSQAKVEPERGKASRGRINFHHFILQQFSRPFISLLSAATQNHDRHTTSSEK